MKFLWAQQDLKLCQNGETTGNVEGPQGSGSNESIGDRPKCADAGRRRKTLDSAGMPPALVAEALDDANDKHRACLKRVGDAIAAELCA